jgi:hypothetical protein
LNVDEREQSARYDGPKLVEDVEDLFAFLRAIAKLPADEDKEEMSGFEKRMPKAATIGSERANWKGAARIIKQGEGQVVP